MNFFSSFILGLLTPLTAVCVLPLYPAFIAYLSHKLKDSESKSMPFLFGLIVTLGVIVFMALVGIVFTTVLKVSLTNVINIISPIAFSILGVISILLIFDVDFTKWLPKPKVSTKAKNPLVNAFFFGFSFGPIVIPCNPGLIAAFFATTLTRSAGTVATNMLHFLFFGLGIGFPLMILSVVSASWSTAIIAFLTKRKRIINLLAGLIMLSISIYYLVFVFQVFG